MNANPPKWPSSVHVFQPTTKPEEINNIIKTTSSELQDKSGHYSSQRIAYLFKPGIYYDLNIPVGYYVQCLGLGQSASDVYIYGSNKDPGIYAMAADRSNNVAPGSLDTFWRSAENFTILTSKMIWAVSQAAPLRRVHVIGDMQLYDTTSKGEAKYASGGFMSNVLVNGDVDFGSQQQYCLRNCSANKFSGGAWSLVFVDCNSAAPKTQGKTAGAPCFSNKSDHRIVDKPYIVCNDDNEKFSLCVPCLTKSTTTNAALAAATGSTYADKEASIAGGCGSRLDRDKRDELRDFERVFVAVAGSGIDIQSQLDRGYDIVFSPGIHILTQPLIVKTSNQVLLGIGLATLVASPRGCIIVQPHITGVRIAGLMLQASVPANYSGSFLMKIGEEHSKADKNKTVVSAADDSTPAINNNNNNNNSTTAWEALPSTPACVLSDIFCRVGGPESISVDTNNLRCKISVETMILIHADDVIGDNLWLWRADHSLLGVNETPKKTPTGETEVYHLVEYNKEQAVYEYRCDHALVVTGQRVVMCGLAAEHTLKSQVVWKGNFGSTYFYQCEMPYDSINNESAAYVGYEIDRYGSVTHHTLVGAGVYTFFRDEMNQVKTAFSTPLPDTSISLASLQTAVYEYISAAMSPRSPKSQTNGVVGSTAASAVQSPTAQSTATAVANSNPISSSTSNESTHTDTNIKNTTSSSESATVTPATGEVSTVKKVATTGTTTANGNSNTTIPSLDLKLQIPVPSTETISASVIAVDKSIPTANETIQLINIFTVYLTGKGGIDSIINNATTSASSGGGRVGEEIDKGKCNAKYLDQVFIKPTPTPPLPPVSPRAVVTPVQSASATNTKSKPIENSNSYSSFSKWFGK